MDPGAVSDTGTVFACIQICRLSSPIAIAIQTAIVQVWEPCSSMNDGLDELQESWKQQ